MIYSAYPVPAAIYGGNSSETVPVYHYYALPSTNLTAKEILTGDPRRGVILADRQTAGRGRLGRSFFSEGGIYLSCMIPVNALSFSPALLTTAAAAAVFRAVTAEGFEVKIKWVNDILLPDGKKVCGILAETASEGDILSGYVVGIGINIGAPDFPEELAKTAGALSGGPEMRERLIGSVIQNLYAAITEAPEDLIACCTENSCVIGRQVRYFGGAAGTGYAVRLDPLGGLVVKREDGAEITLTGGEISVRTE